VPSLWRTTPISNAVVAAGENGHCWYVRASVPDDLREIFRKRTIEHALNTSDIAEARRRTHAVLTEIFDSFERARRGLLSSSDIEQEAQRFLRDQLEHIQKQLTQNCGQLKASPDAYPATTAARLAAPSALAIKRKVPCLINLRKMVANVGRCRVVITIDERNESARQ